MGKLTHLREDLVCILLLLDQYIERKHGLSVEEISKRIAGLDPKRWDYSHLGFRRMGGGGLYSEDIDHFLGMAMRAGRLIDHNGACVHREHVRGMAGLMVDSIVDGTVLVDDLAQLSSDIGINSNALTFAMSQA